MLENPDGISGFAQVGSDISQGTQSYNHIVPLYARVNAQYILQNCNASGCNDSSIVDVSGTLVEAIGYFKASNTDGGDSFSSVSFSADGTTLAVGAGGEESSATGIDGDQTDNSAGPAGAVYVFTRSGGSWAQQAYIKASNTSGCNWMLEYYCDWFGYAVSLSADGNTLAVGAFGERSSATGINGIGYIDLWEDDAAGAVYVFRRNDSTWSQQAYVKASNTEAFSFDHFGFSVSLSADSNTLAVGAPGEESSATGIDGDQTDNSASWAGAVYLY